MATPELDSLARVWNEHQDRLREADTVKQFNERLRREWSIETGVIERLYTIDRGITQLLIEQGIDSALFDHFASDRPPSEVVRILQDHCDALDGIFDFVATRRLLTVTYIRDLHQVITQHQEYVDVLDQFGNPSRLRLERGAWKRIPNNPTRRDGSVHHYCPPLQVQGQMEMLIALHNAHQDVSPEVEAAWLHHRFTQIHPFQDGNGRVARALATMVFLRAGWFPLVIHRDQRMAYIEALEAADHGDLQPLARLFASNAKGAFTRALGLSESVLRGEESLPSVVRGLAERYRDAQAIRREREREERCRSVESIADQLIEVAHHVLDEVAEQIRYEFRGIHPVPKVWVNGSRDTNRHYYTAQIISTAKDLDYFANVTRRRNWVRLHLQDGLKTHIVFSFHYLGKVDRGVMACSGFIYFPEAHPDAPVLNEEDEAPEVPLGETHRISREVFLFSYQDADRLENLATELRKWMTEAVSVGLAEWGQRF